MDSKHFHASTTARKKRNHICALEDDGRSKVEGCQEIIKLTLDYFAGIYDGFVGDHKHVVEKVAPKITQQENDRLIRCQVHAVNPLEFKDQERLLRREKGWRKLLFLIMFLAWRQ